MFEQARYLIVIRNPIKRAISAFNWRYHLVVETQAQRDRFEGEYDILKRYQTLSTIAESLYTEGVLNPRVVAEFQSIHHLRENMAFYLADFLEQVHPAQIFGVLSTESLTADARIQLGIDDLPKIYVHGSLVPSEKKILRENGYNNIKNYLASDYECLRRLLALNHTTKTSSRVLLR